MSDYSDYPQALHEILEIIDESSQSDRHEILLDYSDRFEEVPATIATRPFPEINRVKQCESEAYVFAESGEDDGINFYFAVENPQGVSARALSAILQETLQGASLEDIEKLPEIFVYKLFGRGVSMGKGAGLMGIISLLKYFARQTQQTEG